MGSAETLAAAPEQRSRGCARRSQSSTPPISRVRIAEALRSHLDGSGLIGYLEVVEETSLAEPQLSVRSAMARDLAHRLARRESRTVADIVERALQAYEARETGREPAAAFYARMRSDDVDDDVDLDAVIREGRRAHPGPDL